MEPPVGHLIQTDAPHSHATPSAAPPHAAAKQRWAISDSPAAARAPLFAPLSVPPVPAGARRPMPLQNTDEASHRRLVTSR